jgi:hypothetical protein
MPVAEDQRVNPGFLEAEANRVLIRLRRLAARDIDRIARGTERRDELAERGIEVGGRVVATRPPETFVR